MSANQDILRYVASYHRGVLTAVEVATRLVELATTFDLASVAAETPDAVLAEVRGRTTDIPNPEDVIVFRFGPGFGQGTEEERAEQERYVAGLRTWKAYFDATD